MGVISGVAGIFGAIGQFNQAKSNARMTAVEGKITAERRAKEIRQVGAVQRVSYLNSGLELEGTPATVIQDTYQTGLEDVNAIRSSYNRQVKNMMTQARAELFGNLLNSSIQIGAGLYSAGAMEGMDFSNMNVSNAFNFGGQ